MQSGRSRYVTRRIIVGIEDMRVDVEASLGHVVHLRCAIDGCSFLPYVWTGLVFKNMQ